MHREPADTMLADKLRSLRRKYGLSQQEVAYELGVSRQTVSNWEAGQGAPALDKAAQLAGLYHVSLDELARPDVAISVAADPGDERPRDLHLLNALVGKRCSLGFSDDFLTMRIGAKPVTVLAVSPEWMRVSYEPDKRAPSVTELIDLDAVVCIDMLEG